MKISTYKQVQRSIWKKGLGDEKLNIIEQFIYDYAPRGDEKHINKFMRDLQKLVDFIEEESCRPLYEKQAGVAL